ncbi:MAG: hypothetical protein QXI60_10210 [Thermofilaceae archaeon]
MNKRAVLLPTLVLIVSAVALAAVFAYYPLTITVLPIEPGVVFVAGSNAGQPDIGTENQIQVFIGDNKTSASVTIHPTYQENYYKDVLRIVNNDDNAMNVYIMLTSASPNLPADSIVKLFFYQGNTKVKELDITTLTVNQPYSVGQIPVGGTWQIDFYVFIPEGTSITEVKYEAKLVYTPSEETPPPNPAIGR